MDINQAKKLIGSYLDYRIHQDVKKLGVNHFIDACECTVGELQSAFELLDRNYNYFKGD
jgi:hypothetical protein